MTFGTPTNLGYSQPHRSCALTSSLVVVVREDQSNSSRLTVRAATVSGTTMSWGTEVYDNSYQTISYYNIKRLTDNSFVISFTCNTYTYCVIGTVSGNTITLGAPQQLGADYRGSWALGRLSDTSFVFNTYKNSTSKSYLCIASVSGTTISYGTPYDVSATLGYDQYRYCKDIVGLSSTTFAICGANAAYDKSGVLVVTFSGTTISSLGTFYDYEPVVGAYTSMILIDTNKLLISYQDSGNSNYSKLVIATNSSGTISFGTIYSLRVAYGNFYVAPVDITHFRLAYQGASNSSQTRSGTISGTTITGLDDAEEYNADNRQGQFICSLSSTLFALSYQEPGANGYILIGNNVVAPTVTTQAATDVADTSCTGNGNITSNGGGVITEKGICYKVGTTGDPTTADSTVHDHTDSTGAFTEAITGLTANTGYRMRAYAINSAGTSYGETVQVTTTTVAPTVSTQAATDIDNTSITGNGNITATGGANATRRGFCYKTGTTGDPTTADTVAYDDGDFGTGAYTKSITSLTSKSYYRVRAYAVNSEGTSYGTTIQANTFKFTFGAETVFYDGTVYVDKISTCYLDSTHVVVAYVNNEDHGYARIGVITGNEVVFGDPYEFIDDASNYTSVSALDSTHFVVGFRHTDVDGYCKIGTVSNDDEIAYGSEYEFLNEDVSNFSVAGLDSTHFVVGYIDASNQGRAKVGTVSNGNEIAYGTSAFSTSNFNVTGVCKLDSTHFAIIGNGVVSNYGLSDVGTVSGDSITFTGYQTFDNTGSVITFNCSAITSTYFAIAYTVDGHGYIKICRASTVGSAYEFNNATSSFINVVALDENLITIVYQDNNVGYVLIGYVSNNTELYFGEKKIFNNASSVGNVITILSSTKIAISFRDDGDSSKGKTMIGSFVQNLTQALSDSFSFSSSLLYTESLYKTSSLSFSETKTLKSEYFKNIVSSLSLSDIKTLTSEFFRKLYDECIFLESSIKTSEYNKNLTDIVSLAESLSIKTRINLIDSLLFVELLFFETGREQKQNESLTLTEQNTKGIKQNKIENVSFNETKSLSSIFINALEEKLNITENNLKEFYLNTNVLLSLNEYLFKKIDIRKTIQMSLLENIIKNIILKKEDDVLFEEFLFKDKIKNLSENIIFIESLLTDKDFNKIFDEILSLQETDKKDIQKQKIDIFNLSETLVLTSLYQKIFDENFQLSEKLNKNEEINKHETITIFEKIAKIMYLKSNESLSLSEKIFRILDIEKIENLIISDFIKKEIKKTKSEILNLTESVLTTKEYFRFFEEYLSIEEPLVFDIGKNVFEMLIVAETVKKEIKIPKGDTLIISEQITKDLSRPLHDSITEFKDEITKQYRIDLSEDINLIDFVSKLSDFNLSLGEMLELEAAISFLQVEPFTSKKTTLINKDKRVVLISTKNKTILISK